MRGRSLLKSQLAHNKTGIKPGGPQNTGQPWSQHTTSLLHQQFLGVSQMNLDLGLGYLSLDLPVFLPPMPQTQCFLEQPLRLRAGLGMIRPSSTSFKIQTLDLFFSFFKQA